MLYRKIKILCKEKNISISKMERELEFPRGYVFQWSRIEPGVQKVKKVADYLGVSIEELIKEEVITG
jgi:transcriptional regulator with XRE-family HTH domain